MEKGQLIILVGLPGSGKTTVGRLLAQEMQVPFHDFDDLLLSYSKTQGLEEDTPQTLYSSVGVERFRELERETLKRMGDFKLGGGRVVLAAGGGTFEREENRELLQIEATFVYLKVPLNDLIKRLSTNPDRPLFRKNGVQKTVEQLLARREPIFMRIADITVYSASEPPKVVEEIKKEIERGNID